MQKFIFVKSCTFLNAEIIYIINNIFDYNYLVFPLDIRSFFFRMTFIYFPISNQYSLHFIFTQILPTTNFLKKQNEKHILNN